MTLLNPWVQRQPLNSTAESDGLEDAIGALSVDGLTLTQSSSSAYRELSGL